MKKLLFILFAFINTCIFSQKHMMHDFYYYTNPNHPSKVYNNILVITDMDRTTQKRMKKSARKKHFKITFYESIFPPIKKYSDAEIDSVCKSLGIDGVLYYLYGGSEVTGSIAENYGNIFLNKNGANTYSNTTIKTLRYFKMSLYFMDVADMNIKQYYVTGGYGPKYSYHIGSALFMKSLKILIKEKIALPPAVDTEK